MTPFMQGAALHVVTLGSGAGLQAIMRGIAAACSPRAWSGHPSAPRDPGPGVRGRLGGAGGAHRLGSLTLTSPGDPGCDLQWTVRRVDDPSARQAIAAADLIVLGPGGMSTHLLPVLLLRPIAEEMGRSRARVVLVMSLMTEPGGTDVYVASDCVRAIRRHAPEVPIHDVLLNDATIPGRRVVACARNGALPIGYDTGALEALGCRALKGDLLWDGPAVRHDPRKVGRAILRLLAAIGTWAGDPRCAGAARGADVRARQEFTPTDSAPAG